MPAKCFDKGLLKAQSMLSAGAHRSNTLSPYRLSRIIVSKTSRKKLWQDD